MPSQTRTLSQLRTEVLQTADMENVSNFIDATTGGELDRYINQSLRELYDLIIQHQGQEFFMERAWWHLIPDTDLYTFGGTTLNSTGTVKMTDMYLFIGMDIHPLGSTDASEKITAISQLGNSHIPMKPLHTRHRYGGKSDSYDYYPSQVSQNGSLTDGTPLYYQLLGKDSNSSTLGHLHRVRVWPVPDKAYTITTWYIPQPVDLTTGGSLVGGLNGWEDYVVVDAAIKCLQKEESDTSALEMRKQRLIDRISTLASVKNQGDTEYIADTEELW